MTHATDQQLQKLTKAMSRLQTPPAHAAAQPTRPANAPAALPHPTATADKQGTGAEIARTHPVNRPLLTAEVCFRCGKPDHRRRYIARR